MKSSLSLTLVALLLTTNAVASSQKTLEDYLSEDYLNEETLRINQDFDTNLEEMGLSPLAEVQRTKDMYEENSYQNVYEEILLQDKLQNHVAIPLSEITNESHKKLLLAAGATGILISFDQKILNIIQDYESDAANTLAELGNHLGSDYLIDIVGATYAIGLISGDTKLKNTAYQAVGSAVLAEIVVEVMKSFTHRARPDKDEGPYSFDGFDWGSGNTSFVSGHAAGAWSVATIIAREYKDTKIVPYIAYGLASLVSLSRVYQNKHWPSDVVLGSLVGYAAGNIIFNFMHRNDHSKKKSNVLIIPDIRMKSMNNNENKNDPRYDPRSNQSFVGVTIEIKLGKKSRQKFNH